MMRTSVHQRTDVSSSTPLVTPLTNRYDINVTVNYYLIMIVILHKLIMKYYKFLYFLFLQNEWNIFQSLRIYYFSFEIHIICSPCTISTSIIFQYYELCLLPQDRWYCNLSSSCTIFLSASTLHRLVITLISIAIYNLNIYINEYIAFFGKNNWLYA